MKKTYLFLIILFGLTCRAQSPIIDLLDDDGSTINGAYYKDTNNILNQFDGTWLYTNGTTSFKMVLVKKELIYVNNYYEDLIIGEYQYIKDGEELHNSLYRLDENLDNLHNHTINGNNFPTTSTPFEAYTSDNFRIKLYLEEPFMGCNLDLKRTVINGQDALLMFKNCQALATQQYPQVLSPSGIYILIKQP